MPASFEEAMALGEAAVIGQQWSEAAANYTLALKLADKDKIGDSLRKEAIDALVNALYTQARSQLISGKWEDCLGTTDKIFKEYKDSPAAPMAGSLAVSAALNLYAAAPEGKKTAALERLKKYARLTEEAWPGKPEADDARMMLAQADLVQGKIDEALAGFEKIDPRSERYPNALLLAAETYFRRWLAEKEKPENSQKQGPNGRRPGPCAEESERQPETAREKNRARRAALQIARSRPNCCWPKSSSTGRCRRGGGLVATPGRCGHGLANPKKSITSIVRIYAGAVRAYLALDNPEKAAEIGMLLADWGPDVQNVNAALVEVVKMLNDKRKLAEAASRQARAMRILRLPRKPGQN